MKEKLRSAAFLVLTMVIVLMVSKQLPADTGTCGGTMTTLPFTDVMGSPFFCQIAEAYFSGLTNGTSPTTYSPSNPVTRDQMAAFITRTQDSALRRGSRRAALKQWWTPSSGEDADMLIGFVHPVLVESDGEDLWVADIGASRVVRVHASNGRNTGEFTGLSSAFGVLIFKTSVFVTGNTSPGRLWEIRRDLDKVLTQPNLGDFPEGIATDGRNIWTANTGIAGTGSVSRFDFQSFPINITTGFSSPSGILFDGSNIWVADQGDNMLKKLDSNGAVLQSVAVGTRPRFPVFDGSNIWVPNMSSNSITVVRARDGMALATLTGNGLNQPIQAAFDGQKVLVTNAGSTSLSLWKAADLTPTGTLSAFPFVGVGACSDGTYFWVTIGDPNIGILARY